MIRPATHDDLPAILAMGARFYATTSYAGVTPYCEESIGNLVGGLIETGIFLVAERGGELVGMVGLAVAPFLFNNAINGAYEVVWWVNPEQRGSVLGMHLLRAIEPAAKAKGCRLIQMVRMANSPPQADALYMRQGYAHTETSFTKVLEG